MRNFFARAILCRCVFWLAVDDLAVCAWTEECKSLTWLRRMSNPMAFLIWLRYHGAGGSLDPVNCEGLDQAKYFRASFRFRLNLQTSSSGWPTT